MTDSLGQHCPNCEEQAGVIVALRNRLGFVLDREADTQRRHDVNVAALEEAVAYWKSEIRIVRRELKSEQKQTDSAMDNYDEMQRRCEAQAAEIEKLREALAALIEQCHQCEKELTEAHYKVDFCGESLPLCNARAAFGETK